MEGRAQRTWKGFSAFFIIGAKEEGFECHSPVKLVVGDGGVLPVADAFQDALQI